MITQPHRLSPGAVASCAWYAGYVIMTHAKGGGYFLGRYTASNVYSLGMLYSPVGSNLFSRMSTTPLRISFVTILVYSM